jgi:hypothetical protein
MAANWEIDDKPAVISPAITDLFPCTQSGNVRKITAEQILSLASDEIDAIALQWKEDDNTWAPAATGDANFPEWVIGVDADVTFLKIGQKIKYTQTTIKYGIITKVGAWSGSTTPITVYMGGTFAAPSWPMTNAEITVVYYSTTLRPLDFPLGLDMWSTIFTDSGSKFKDDSVAVTWYGGVNSWTTGTAITPYIGTGLWDVELYAVIYASQPSVTLSSSNSVSGSVDLTYNYLPYTGGSVQVSCFRYSELYLASVTEHWVLASCQLGGDLYIQGNVVPTKVKVKCLYL